jgi:phosphoheptose isomerase
MLNQAFRLNKTLFLCGNGGSAADAEHMAGELLKGFLLPRKLNSDIKKILKEKYGDDGIQLADKLQEGFRTITLNSHPSFLTAYSNDVDYNAAFAQQIYVLGNKGDILIGFTTSGNSPNILNAFKVAAAAGITTIAMTGLTGGKAADIANCCIQVPEKETYKIQELHLPIYHALCAALEDEFYG